MDSNEELLEAMEHLSTMVREVLDDNRSRNCFPPEGGVDMPDWIVQGYQACNVVDDHVRGCFEMNRDVPDEGWADGN